MSKRSEELVFWLRWNMAFQIACCDLYITEAWSKQNVKEG